jgi:pimeloyl-ACP methyl ester carboxylesterase
MENKKIRISDIDIMVYQKGTDGQPVLFVHGNSLSALTYANQFNSFLGNKYRLIAFDLPGHGKSSPAIEPTTMYSIPWFNEILIGLVESLSIKNAVFVGHSLGGHMLIEAYEHLREATGFLIFGAPPVKKPDHPMERSHYPHPAYPLAFTGTLSQDEVNDLATVYVKKDSEIPDIIFECISGTDNQMRANLGANTSLDKLLDEAGIVAGMKRPLAIFHGREDQMIRGEYFDELTIPALWRGKVHKIPDSGHCPQLENPVKFNRLLDEFLEDIT